MALFAALPLFAFPFAAAVADPAATGAQLYLNVSGDGLNDKLSSSSADGGALGADDTASASSSKKIDLGSVPFTVSTADSTGGWGAVLGGTGQYVVPLSDGFSLVNHGAFTKSQTSSGFLGATSADAGPGLEYREGNLALALQPDVGVTLQSEALQQLDYGLSSSLSKDLMAGLTATTTTGYTIQGGADGDSRLAHASTALSYALPDKIKLGLGYQLEQTLSSGNQLLSGQQGPSLTAEIPVTDSVKLGTSYSYNSTATDSDSLDLTAKHRDTSQTLGLSADWDVGAQINADVKLSAKVDVSRATEYGSNSAELQQAGSVGMQMKF
ncbi:MAG TPA: hypothetical protein VM639_19080 [Dongiaceae bacterium]|nr:hypothetical protein [Dongiaceae bacterium]